MPAYSDDQVARGRRLVTDLDRAQFGLGDLALEVAPRPHVRTCPSGRDGSFAVLADFAHDIGTTPKRLSEWRLVSDAWPDERRWLNVSWSVHRALISDEERFETMRAFVADCQERHVNPTVRELRRFTKSNLLKHEEEVLVSPDVAAAMDEAMYWMQSGRLGEFMRIVKVDDRASLNEWLDRVARYEDTEFVMMELMEGMQRLADVARDLGWARLVHRLCSKHGWETPLIPDEVAGHVVYDRKPNQDGELRIVVTPAGRRWLFSYILSHDDWRKCLSDPDVYGPSNLERWACWQPEA